MGQSWIVCFEKTLFFSSFLLCFTFCVLLDHWISVLEMASAVFSQVILAVHKERKPSMLKQYQSYVITTLFIEYYMIVIHLDCRMLKKKV